MKKGIERISVNAFEKAVKDVYEPVSEIQYGDLTIIVNKNIGLNQTMEFINSCVNACFDETGSKYIPEAKELAVNTCIITFYTNISLPMSLEKQYDLIYNSGIISLIKPYIDSNQLNDIINAINEKIKNINALNTVFVNREIMDCADKINSLYEQVSSVFQNITPDDVKGVMQAVSDNGLDEEKLVKAYIENKQNGGGQNG